MRGCMGAWALGSGKGALQEYIDTRGRQGGAGRHQMANQTNTTPAGAISSELSQFHHT